MYKHSGGLEQWPQVQNSTNTVLLYVQSFQENFYSPLSSLHPQDMWSLVLAIFVLLAERTAEHAKHLITKFQPCDTTRNLKTGN